MNTKLIPPDITPGPWKTDGKIHDSNYFVECREGWDVAAITTAQAGNSHCVAKFIAASPAVAEVLAAWVSQDMEHDDFVKRFGFSQSHLETATKEALLSAGYTLAADPE
jgi:hypothetical protein